MTDFRNGDITAGESELDHLLEQSFPGLRARMRRTKRPIRRRDLHGILDQGVDIDPNMVGIEPGYSVETATAKGSVIGRGESALTPQAPSTPGIKIDPSTMNDLSRMLEQTFRNFQLHARPPSHIAPPFTAKPIDAFPNAVVSLPAGNPGAYTSVASFQVPVGPYRGEAVALGQSAESQVAWNNIEWQVQIDGNGRDPWTSVKIQLWQMMPPTPLPVPIHLTGGQTVSIFARTLNGNGPYSVLARIFGWWYPVRAEVGNLIGSTLVD